MYKVGVIMSTYNGEQYIESQIKSIFNQKNVCVQLFIRDDGSSDNTIKIIEVLKSIYPITLIVGDSNLGPSKSFLRALKLNYLETDFYAYCDQDDVWYDNKLITACEALAHLDNTKPNLYCSSYDVVDQKLNKMFTRDLSIHGELSLYSTILGICPSGCTMVFNSELEKTLKDTSPQTFRMHDFWTMLVAQSLEGTVIIDNVATMAYRQHGENAVGFTNRISLKHIFSLISQKSQRKFRKEEVVSLITCLNGEISENKIATLLKIKFYDDSWKNKFRLLGDSNFKIADRYRRSMFILSVLLGAF